MALFGGKLHEAERFLEPGVSGDLERNDMFVAAHKLVGLAEIHLLRGDAGAAANAAERALALSDDMAIRFSAALVRLKTGDGRGAMELAERLASEDDSESKALADVLHAEALLDEGNPKAAIRILLGAREIADTWLGRYALGRAYLEAEAFLRQTRSWTRASGAEGKRPLFFSTTSQRSVSSRVLLPGR